MNTYQPTHRHQHVTTHVPTQSPARHSTRTNPGWHTGTDRTFIVPSKHGRDPNSAVSDNSPQTRRALGGAYVPPTKVFRRLTGSVNKMVNTTPRCSGQYVYVGCSRRKIPRSSACTILEKAIRFRQPDCNQDQAQKLISSSMSRHLSTRSISSKSMHVFMSNLANRQTDRETNKRTRAKTFTSSFVGAKLLREGADLLASVCLSVCVCV